MSGEGAWNEPKPATPIYRWMYGDITFFTILFKYSGVQTVKEMLVQRPANVTLRDTGGPIGGCQWCNRLPLSACTNRLTAHDSSESHPMLSKPGQSTRHRSVPTGWVSPHALETWPIHPTPVSTGRIRFWTDLFLCRDPVNPLVSLKPGGVRIPSLNQNCSSEMEFGSPGCICSWATIVF
jgi:hypothetical protein